MVYRYSGTFFYLKYLFIQYLSIAGPAALIALVAGLGVTVAGFIMLIFRRYRKNASVLTVLALLPILIGVWGTVLTTHSAEEIAAFEKKIGIEPTANRYYDFEYLYSKKLLYWFPAVVGTASAVPPLFLAAILRRKVRKEAPTS